MAQSFVKRVQLTLLAYLKLNEQKCLEFDMLSLALIIVIYGSPYSWTIRKLMCGDAARVKLA